MNAREEFNKIKEKYFETKERNLDFKGRNIEVSIEFFNDMETLINIIDTMEKVDKIYKNSLYGIQAAESIERKRRMKNQDIEVITTDGVFHYSNVYIEIYDNKIIIIGDGKLTQYNMHYLILYNLKPHKEIKLEEDELGFREESEVE